MADARTIMNGRAMVESTAGTLSAYASVTLESVRGSHAWEDEVIKDAGGFDVAWLARNEHITIDINLKLSGMGKAAAKANGAFLLPLGKITLYVFDLPWLNETGVAPTATALNGGATIYSGSWQYFKGGSVDLTADKVGGMSLSLRKYANPTQNAASTTPAPA